MPLEPDGNYYADLPDPPLGGIGGTGITHGTGAPDANTPISSGYINDTNGDFYVNTTGDSSGWILAGGSGAASQALTDAYDDPNGNVVPPNTVIGAVYYKDQSTPVVFWIWSVAGQNWILLTN